MKFYGHGIVKLPGQKRRVKFVKASGDPYKLGVFETDDLSTADKLMKLGYKGEGVMPENPDKDEPAKRGPKPKSEKAVVE